MLAPLNSAVGLPCVLCGNTTPRADGWTYAATFTSQGRTHVACIADYHKIADLVVGVAIGALTIGRAARDFAHVPGIWDHLTAHLERLVRFYTDLGWVVAGAWTKETCSKTLLDGQSGTLACARLGTTEAQRSTRGSPRSGLR